MFLTRTNIHAPLTFNVSDSYSVILKTLFPAWIYRSTHTDLSIPFYLATFIFNLYSTWRINLITRPLYTETNGPQNPLNRGLGELQSRSWRFGENTYTRTLLVSRLHRSVVNNVPVDTALSNELAPSFPQYFYTPTTSQFASSVTVRLNLAS
jgi:hypothetical protein